jgi:3-keto-5-aminohexanoate cleavage enzyme
VGMENNLYYRKEEKAKSNAQLLAGAVWIARELNREPATPDEERAILGIKKL